MIFVDTSAWYSRYVWKDPNHAAAKRFDDQPHDEFVTSDYIIDELLTLLKSRGNVERAVEVGNVLFAGELAEIEWVSKEDVGQAWEIFELYRDKEWSFTDCVSLAMMRRLGITKAFAFDQHFRQFGTVTVLP
ncbi:MAG TPA: PIN domain-containing protein [Urbifossiella sp.]